MPKIVKANCDDTAHLTPKKERTTVKLTSARSDIVIKKGYSPYIGDDGHWYEYDADICAFVDTGIVAQGESGKDGYTPIKGIDYFTEDDYQAIAELMPTVPDWAMAEVKPTYTASEVGAAEIVHKHTLDDLGSFQPMELTLKRNTYVETNGLEKPYSTWTSTDFIPVESGKRYQLYWNLTSSYCCWYNSDQTFLAQVTFNNGMTDFFPPAGAAFLRVSNRDASMATLTISTVQGLELVKSVNGISPDSRGNVTVSIPFDSIDENTLIARDGVLSVITTDIAEQDNTKPITSSGVHVIVGNIDTLLSLI